MEKKNAYLYYLGNYNRLSELVVSIESLRKTNPKYPIICLMGPEAFSEKKLVNFVENELNIKVYSSKVPTDMHLVDIYGNVDASFYCVGRLEMFGLFDYDKIVMLGTDTYVVQNIDELFNYPSGSMCSHHTPDWWGQGSNGDLVICEPDQHLLDELHSMLVENYKEGKFTVAFDQSFLDVYYDFRNRPELHLNYIYNCIVENLNYYKSNPLFDFESIKIFHFMGLPKYEDRTCINDFNNKDAGNDYELSNKLIEKYLTFFDHIINKYKRKYPYMQLANSVYYNLEN